MTLTLASSSGKMKITLPASFRLNGTLIASTISGPIRVEGWDLYYETTSRFQLRTVSGHIVVNGSAIPCTTVGEGEEGTSSGDVVVLRNVGGPIEVEIRDR